MGLRRRVLHLLPPSLLMVEVALNLPRYCGNFSWSYRDIGQDGSRTYSRHSSTRFLLLTSPELLYL